MLRFILTSVCALLLLTACGEASDTVAPTETVVPTTTVAPTKTPTVVDFEGGSRDFETSGDWGGESISYQSTLPWEPLVGDGECYKNSEF